MFRRVHLASVLCEAFFRIQRGAWHRLSVGFATSKTSSYLGRWVCLRCFLWVIEGMRGKEGLSPNGSAMVIGLVVGRSRRSMG